MLAPYVLWPCVCLFVCLSQVLVLLKLLLNIVIQQHCRTVAHALWLFDAKDTSEIRPGSTLGVAKCTWGGL